MPIRAEVTDDVTVKSVYLFYGFSRFWTSEPKKYNRKDLTRNRLGIYTGNIPPQNEEGYVWYYLKATDNEGKNDLSEVLKIEIIVQENPPEKPKGVSTVPVQIQTSAHQGIWVGGWSSSFSDNDRSVFDWNWNKGDVISLAYLREGKTYQTYGVRLDYSHQNPPNMSATFQWSPSLGKSPIVFTLLGGVTRYNNSNETIFTTPIFGVGLKYYPLERITFDVIGSFKIPSNSDTTYLYHYEIGYRFYITRLLNLKFGYGQWYFGEDKTKRIQMGLGITF